TLSTPPAPPVVGAPSGPSPQGGQATGPSVAPVPSGATAQVGPITTGGAGTPATPQGPAGLFLSVNSAPVGRPSLEAQHVAVVGPGAGEGAVALALASQGGAMTGVDFAIGHTEAIRPRDDRPGIPEAPAPGEGAVPLPTDGGLVASLDPPGPPLGPDW